MATAPAPAATETATATAQLPADRNKDAIVEKLKEIFANNRPEPNSGEQLEMFEIGSGTGHHILHFSIALPWIKWTPSDLHDVSLQVDSNAYVTFDSVMTKFKNDDDRPANIEPPIRFDVTEPVGHSLVGQRKGCFDGVLNINMIHITSWDCTVGLFKAASYLLKSKGSLITYGAYAVDGVLEPESNVEFDKKLRSKNPEWGVRDVRDLKVLATLHGLNLVKVFEMPSNNKLLLFQKV